MTNEQLATRDYVMCIDKSSSMSKPHKNTTRWKYAQEQAEGLARKCAEFDADGIDVIIFAGTVKAYNNVTPDKVAQIFAENEPNGTTATDLALKTVFDSYFAKKDAGNAKPVTCIVITDGEPNDRKAVAKVIVDAANKIEADEELAVTFIQVGDDAGARAFLESLDNDLQSQGAKFDIVDCKNEEEMENMTMTDILVAAVED
jgi:uncharacterized protein YegL